MEVGLITANEAATQNGEILEARYGVGSSLGGRGGRGGGGEINGSVEKIKDRVEILKTRQE